MIAAIFLCTVAAAGIYDGDTWRCTDGTRVRLAAVDAPEMRRCPHTRRCVPGDPHKAKAALSALIAGKTLRCEKTGRSYDRVTAFCSVGGRDVSCAMLRTGTVAYAVKFDPRGRLRRC